MDEMFTPSVGCADSSPTRGEPDFSPSHTYSNSLPPCGGGAERSEAEGGTRKFAFLKWFLAILPPVVLSVLFEVLKSNTDAMDFWVHTCLAPVIQTIGKFWSLFPFSAAEVIIALGVAALVLWPLRAVVLLVKQRRLGAFLHRLLAMVCALAWAWSIFCWSWNCTYYATGFAARNGLSRAPYSPEQLIQATVYFARSAARFSVDVPRAEDLSFALSVEECFERGVPVYDNLSGQFPDLALSYRQAKPLVCSRLQSILGYTGIYFPFTGEANVNVDQATCLVPATIAHEMAHQRLVSSEQECNFLGVMACVTCDDVVYQYSGYLMGLIYLVNALQPIAPQVVEEIMRQTFTTELYKDWQDNYEYWDALKTPTREVANEAMDHVYDSYLKSQGQELGLMSYSACVDLLVNAFSGNMNKT